MRYLKLFEQFEDWDPIKLFEQFDEEESWWDEESPFDNIKARNNTIEIGDIVARTWPSGHITLGKVNKAGMFQSLENYPLEGGVTKGGVYGYVIHPSGRIGDYAKIPYRLATEKEKSELGL